MFVFLFVWSLDGRQIRNDACSCFFFCALLRLEISAISSFGRLGVCVCVLNVLISLVCGFLCWKVRLRAQR